MKSFDHLLQELEVCHGDLLYTLKQIPRAGKWVRIQHYGLKLPARSVFDHVVSLPAQAQLWRIFSDINPDQVVPSFLFHDLSEALIGDVPSFTKAQLAQGFFMTAESKESAERLANEKLLMTLSEPLKGPFAETLELLKRKESAPYKFFNMVDKTDPIMAVWRYIYTYRSELRIDPFIEAMSDFFLNPEPQRSCTHEEALKVVRVLQNKGNAKHFFERGETFFDLHFDKETSEIIKKLIIRKMNFVKK